MSSRAAAAVINVSLPPVQLLFRLATLASSDVVESGERDNIFMASYFDKSVASTLVVAEEEALLTFAVVVVGSIKYASQTSNGGCGVFCRSVGDTPIYCANNFGDVRGIIGDIVLVVVIRQGGGIPSLSSSLLLIILPLVLELVAVRRSIGESRR